MRSDFERAAAELRAGACDGTRARVEQLIADAGEHLDCGCQAAPAILDQARALIAASPK